MKDKVFTAAPDVDTVTYAMENPAAFLEKMGIDVSTPEGAAILAEWEKPLDPDYSIEEAFADFRKAMAEFNTEHKTHLVSPDWRKKDAFSKEALPGLNRAQRRALRKQARRWRK